MTNILTEDLERINEADFIPWEDLRGRTIFITGATGLIGKTLVKALHRANKLRGLRMKLLLLVRDLDRARSVFEGFLDDDAISFTVGNVEDDFHIADSIDFIIHCASQTASRDFVEHAVETIQTIVFGTDHTLKLALEKKVKSYVFLSSMEVYGYPERGHCVSEKDIGCFSPSNLRNSYPISKIAGEALCQAYASEYGVPAKVVRLTQTFGPGVYYGDQRLFAYMARCVIEKKDIVLKTRGETERSYLYTTDAVTAILTVLLKGKENGIYNAADEETYCSIADMADRVAKENGIGVVFDIQKEKERAFPDTLYMDLDTRALRELGWVPSRRDSDRTIQEMMRRMISAMLTDSASGIGCTQHQSVFPN